MVVYNVSPQPVVRSTSCLVLGWGFGVGGSNGAIFGSNKSKMAATAILDNFEWPISATAHMIYLYSDSDSDLCDSAAFLFYYLDHFKIVD